MKIAMIGHKRFPSRAGGVEIVVWNLAVRMARLGHEVYVYNRHCDEKKIREFEGVHIIEIPTFQHQSLNAMVYSLLATVHAIFHRYDVVHYHAEGPSVMLRFARWFGKKTVATIHGLDWRQGKWGGGASRYLLFGEKTAAKCSDALIVLSESTKKYFMERYGRASIFIPNGVEQGTVREPKLIRKYGISGRDYILFLARITPVKRLEYLLDAFSGLKTDKKLIVAGAMEPSTPYIASIREKASRDERVKLIGFVEGAELEELFSNCYLYVLPSDVEGMPISLLEAISYRARVLVSDIPENTEVLLGYGNTFEKGNAESLKARLAYALEHPELYGQDFKPEQTEAQTEEQVDTILSGHDWDAVTWQTLKLYEDIK